MIDKYSIISGLILFQKLQEAASVDEAASPSCCLRRFMGLVRIPPRGLPGEMFQACTSGRRPRGRPGAGWTNYGTSLSLLGKALGWRRWKWRREESLGLPDEAATTTTWTRKRYFSGKCRGLKGSNIHYIQPKDSEGSVLTSSLIIQTQQETFPSPPPPTPNWLVIFA